MTIILYMNQDALYNLNLLPCSENNRLHLVLTLQTKQKCLYM